MFRKPYLASNYERLGLTEMPVLQDMEALRQKIQTNEKSIREKKFQEQAYNNLLEYHKLLGDLEAMEMKIVAQISRIKNIKCSPAQKFLKKEFVSDLNTLHRKIKQYIDDEMSEKNYRPTYADRILNSPARQLGRTLGNTLELLELKPGTFARDLSKISDLYTETHQKCEQNPTWSNFSTAICAVLATGFAFLAAGLIIASMPAFALPALPLLAFAINSSIVMSGLLSLYSLVNIDSFQTFKDYITLDTPFYSAGERSMMSGMNFFNALQKPPAYATRSNLQENRAMAGENVRESAEHRDLSLYSHMLY